MEWYIYPAVVAVGVLVGFINTLAGSGSVISLPLLMFLGLPANVANGTNRIGILIQSVVAVASFKKQKIFNWNEGLRLAIPSVVGSFIGAISAVKLTNEIMEMVIGGLMVVMFFVLLYKPSRWINGSTEKEQKKPGILKILVFFAIGLYGGFIQAGIGLFLLAGLVLGAGMNLVKANAIKVLVVAIYTPIALAVFIYNDQVSYEIGLILALGNAIGAWLAARFAIKGGPELIRYFLLVIVFLSAIKLLGVHKLFF